jgi:hypothetical protein
MMVFIEFLRGIKSKLHQVSPQIDTEKGIHKNSFQHKIEKLLIEINKPEHEFLEKAEFIKIMTVIEFDYKTLAEQYYDHQYKGCLNKVFCSCFKRYLHKRRHQNVLKEYD